MVAIDEDPFALLQMASAALFLALVPIVLLRWYREHREEPGIRGRMAFQAGLCASAAGWLWPVRTAMAEGVVLVSMIVALIGLSACSWARRRLGSEAGVQPLEASR